MTLEERVTAVEVEQSQMREEWRVVQQTPLIQSRLLNALRETQLEHGLKLAEHDRRFAAIDRRFDDVDRQLAELSQGVQTLVGMLTTLIDRDDTRR